MGGWEGKGVEEVVKDGERNGEERVGKDDTVSVDTALCTF